MPYVGPLASKTCRRRRHPTRINHGGPTVPAPPTPVHPCSPSVPYGRGGSRSFERLPFLRTPPRKRPRPSLTPCSCTELCRHANLATRGGRRISSRPLRDSRRSLLAETRSRVAVLAARGSSAAPITGRCRSLFACPRRSRWSRLAPPARSSGGLPPVGLPGSRVVAPAGHSSRSFVRRSPAGRPRASRLVGRSDQC
jgi:hypothetical protein